MFELVQTTTFAKWRRSRGDTRVRHAVASRLDRLSRGHLGDVVPVGDGVSELRIHLGPGIRVYFIQRQSRIIVLLCGGDKATQSRDIDRAKALALDWENHND